MASFKVVERATGREITINVAQFLLRNEYSVYETNKGVIWIDPNGYTTLQYNGDSIIDTIGLDNLIQNEYYFINNPEYYLKLDKTTPSITSTRVYADASTGEVPQYDIYTYYYGNLSLYKDTSTTAIVGLLPVYDYKTFTTIGGSEIDKTFIPFWSSQSTHLVYDPRIAFDFIHKQVALVSPYSWKFPFFFKSNESYKTSVGIYVEPQLLPDNGYTFNNAPKADASNKNTYYYPTPRDFLYFSTLGGGTVNVKKYGDISEKEVITTVSSRYRADVPNTYTDDISANWWLTTYGRTNNRNYDFLFDLLFDKIPTDDPNPYPDEDPDDPSDGPDKPSDGGDGEHDRGSDPIPTPPKPDVTPVGVGAINLYQMTPATYLLFLKYLWSPNFFNAILKLFNDPMECIISAHIIGVNVPTSGNDNITIGNVTTDVKANIVPSNFITVDFGSIDISQFYGDASDYDTEVQLYLPYYGYVTLNTFEVMKSTISLTYNIDVLTGSFAAFISVQKSVDGTNLNSVLYQYNGMMAYQIPIGSTNYSQITAGLIGLVGTVATAGATKTAFKAAQASEAAMGGYVSDTGNFSMQYERSGTLSGNTGYMSIKNAYVTIQRKIHATPNNFAKYVGYPYMGYISLGSCVGFTKCNSVFIDKVIGTPQETEQIREGLLKGVIF